MRLVHQLVADHKFPHRCRKPGRLRSCKVLTAVRSWQEHARRCTEKVQQEILQGSQALTAVRGCASSSPELLHHHHHHDEMLVCSVSLCTASLSVMDPKSVGHKSSTVRHGTAE